MSLPNPINRGEIITANWLNRLLQEVKSNTILPGAGVRVSRLTNGTTIAVNPTAPQRKPDEFMPSLYAYVDENDGKVVSIDATDGNIIYGGTDDAFAFSSAGAKTVSDGDYVWLECDVDDSVWTLNSAATLPRDKWVLALCQVTIDSTGDTAIVTIEYLWNGGDYIFPTVLKCYLVEDGGAAGETGGSNCSFTYTVYVDQDENTDASGLQVLTGATPQQARTTSMLYTSGDAGYGLINIAADGTVTLLCAYGECLDFTTVAKDITDLPECA